MSLIFMVLSLMGPPMFEGLWFRVQGSGFKVWFKVQSFRRPQEFMPKGGQLDQKKKLPGNLKPG